MTRIQRRTFLKRASAATAFALGAGILPRSSWAQRKNTVGKRVAVLGGGVAGMSAAHELMERGFEVSVYEMKAIPGGKARSMAAPGTGSGGRRDLPGEHGFRFFPGFYKHLPDTMRRIPYPGNKNGVFDNLVDATRMLYSSSAGEDLVIPTRFPKSWPEAIDDIHLNIQLLFGKRLGLTLGDQAFFAHRMMIFLTSCEERRLGQWEKTAWWTFVDADSRSEAYKRYLAAGLTRNLVAARPDLMSARTGSSIFIQLMLNVFGQGDSVDRVLNGPTNDVWIDPWLGHLRANGVKYRLGARVKGMELSDGRISAAQVEWDGAAHRVEADHFVLAVPVERVPELLPVQALEADPALSGVGTLRTEWMTGIQFYLSKPFPNVHGHASYFDSPWAITSISQQQFWGKVDLAGFGDGTTRDILSVDISDWNAPGIVYGKPAKNCSADEIAHEVVAQIQAHLDTPFDASMITGWHLDPGITFPSPGQTENAEPLLVNLKGSWAQRPRAVTKIPNLFLASDYVQSHSDLACMEAANEAARYAVNGILEASGSSAEPCRIWPLKEPVTFAPARAIDKLLYKAGHRHRDDSPEGLERALAAAKSAEERLAALMPIGS